MGLLERVAADSHAETRIISGAPWKPWTSPFMPFSVGGPLHPSREFYGVDEGLRLVPLYACVRLIAEYVSSLPVKLYLESPSDRKPRRYRGPSIFDDPAPDTNQMDWVYECMTSLLLQGNAWGYVLSRDGYGYPQQIQWMPPDMVQVFDEETGPFNPLRTQVYFYGRQVSREERFHVKAFSLPGRTEGISPLRAFALTIVNGLEATRYGTDWFKAGGFPPGTFKNNEIEIDSSQSAEIRGLLTQSIRRREPLVYGRDWDYHPVTVPPSEAQFIEAMQMNATQLAAVYGLPPERVGGRRGDSLTYSTVAQSALQIIEALRPWLVRLESAFDRMLPERRHARFDTDALLKTDLRERADIYRVWRDIGYMSIDEMREIDDREALPEKLGTDTIPLEAIVGMSRSTRAIPNTMVPQVTLEAKMIADYLQDVQAGRPAEVGKNPVAPDAPVPDLAVPDTTGGVSQPGAAGTSAVPGVPGTVIPGPGGNPLDPVQSYLFKLISAVRAQVQAEEEARRREPEYVGPWIPHGHEMNGNGRR